MDKRDSFFGGGPNSTALSTRSSTAQFPANGFVLDAVAYYDTGLVTLSILVFVTLCSMKVVATRFVRPYDPLLARSGKY